jgi:hypothetical protein
MAAVAMEGPDLGSALQLASLRGMADDVATEIDRDPTDVLEDPSYRAVAQEVASAIAGDGNGSVGAAVAELEALLRVDTPSE